MVVASIILWSGALLVIAASLAAAATAIRFHRPRLALLAVAPIAVGLAGAAFRLEVPAPSHTFAVIGGVGLALIGVIAGNPITVAVLAFADRGNGATVIDGHHGGIVVTESADGTRHDAEVLRGGTTIGYVERLVVIAAIVLGHLEIVAVVIAVKGLGRFSELDSPEIRERFIIGTLVSLAWAGACALLIVV
ncbi:MAG TPA: hypothetical protein DCP11_10475 [Microbacteriaceae bacterium]|nr:hypothetical protein [Microbacteriaceae bacterium]